MPFLLNAIKESTIRTFSNFYPYLKRLKPDMFELMNNGGVSNKVRIKTRVHES